MTISVCALAGVRASSTLQLATEVRGARLDALVDSGSTHSVDTVTATRLGLAMEERPGLTVGVAYSDRIPALGVCPHVVVQIGAEAFTLNLYVIHLGGYELVLGVNGSAPWGQSCGTSTA
jgi:hypothetical protein